MKLIGLQISLKYRFLKQNSSTIPTFYLHNCTMPDRAKRLFRHLGVLLDKFIILGRHCFQHHICPETIHSCQGAV
jgi:hypothetical protein